MPGGKKEKLREKLGPLQVTREVFLRPGFYKGCDGCQNGFDLRDFHRHRCEKNKSAKIKTKNRKRKGTKDKQEFLWRHFREAKDYEIAVLGRGPLPNTAIS